MTNFIAGNHIQLLRNGAEYFPALLLAIENASHTIYLQTYIYEVDSVGIKIGEALKKAAQRGINVYVLLDGFGCKDMPKIYLQELQKHGVQVMFYRPKISPWTFKKNRLRRLHRKVAVIDNDVGFVGGINIIDDNNVPHNMPPRIDYAVRIQGALLPSIILSAQKLWLRIALTHLQSIQSAQNKADINPGLSTNMQHNYDMQAAFVLRDNVLHRRDIELAYLAAIRQSSSEVIIANAYFVPGRKFRTAIIAAARRGVKVTLLLQGRMEYWLMLATHAFYSQFLKNNINIYEYRHGFMHSKVAVIDCQWATVGSSNIDPFSLLLAREANVVVLNQDFATELRADIMQSIENGAIQIKHSDWLQSNKIKRFFSWLAYGFVRLFLGVIGISKEQ